MMPRFNVEHKGKWACFSTVNNEFLTPFMDRVRYNKWRLKKYGRVGLFPLENTNLMTYEEAMQRRR